MLIEGQESRGSHVQLCPDLGSKFSRSGGMSSLVDADSSEITESGSSLSLDERKARYGVAYVRSICNQAGVVFHEPEAGEDVLAVDCFIHYPQADVRVQVKCTSKWTIEGHSLTFPIEPEWVRKWDECVLPVYFVVVIVPRLAAGNWIRHERLGTFHSTAAFWARLIPGSIGSSVAVPKTQRLTIETVYSWHKDVLEIARAARSA
jgi:hypothetical protein